MEREQMQQALSALPGRIGLYYENLATGEAWGHHAEELFESASVIKLPIFGAVMKLAAAGELDLNERLRCREADKLPSCGALRQALGVSLFGIDIIINNQTGQHAVIDINAFPGEPWGQGLPSPAWRLVAVGG